MVLSAENVQLIADKLTWCFSPNMHKIIGLILYLHFIANKLFVHFCDFLKTNFVSVLNISITQV